ncbi:MAG: LON peptidase substrate-binding domain-containing protein [Verrucomicrobiales bacterium]|nr:LON peptidase substrate-binding domain-containing protein [Verrucomicrobiales bacterium]
MVLGEATHFPRSLMPLYIFEPRYREMLQYALEGDRMFGVAAAVPGIDQESSINPVRPVFTAGLIRACIRHDNGTSHLMLQGLQRVEIVGWDQVYPFRIATIIPVKNVSIDEEGEQQLAYELIALCQKSIEEGAAGATKSGPMRKILEMLSDPAEIADMVGHNFVEDSGRRQELLEIVNVKDRLDFLIQHIKQGAKGL